MRTIIDALISSDYHDVIRQKHEFHSTIPQQTIGYHGDHSLCYLITLKIQLAFSWKPGRLFDDDPSTC